MTKERKPKKDEKLILNDTPSHDSLFAAYNAKQERIDYSKIVTDPRDARKIGTDLTR